MTPCPHCGAEMHAYGLRCPKCGRRNPRTRVDVAGLVFGLLTASGVGLALFLATR